MEDACRVYPAQAVQHTDQEARQETLKVLHRARVAEPAAREGVAPIPRDQGVAVEPRVRPRKPAGQDRLVSRPMVVRDRVGGFRVIPEVRASGEPGPVLRPPSSGMGGG